MFRKRARTPSIADEDHDLLAGLLEAALPEAADTLRPAPLRSHAEQSQIALRPFLLRTWFDYALQHAERILVVAAVAVFAYWLIDGYGRDWFYYWNQSRIPTQVPRQVAVSATTQLPAATPEVEAHLAALPYTTPDMEQALPAPDFLAPQALTAPRINEDPRPQRLQIPAIGVDAAVVEVFVVDGVWQVADYAVGYHHGTALPGSDGNIVLAAHAGLRGALFRDLGALKPGDSVVIEAGGWFYSYRVRSSFSVWPTRVDIMDPTPTPVLTLITCTAWDTQRLVVVADLIDARPLS